MTDEPPVFQYGPPKVFEKRRIGATIRDSLEYGTEPDIIQGMLLHHVEGFVLSEKLADDTQIATEDVPATWWQHFKYDCKGKWWYRWSPLRWLKEPKMFTIQLSVTWERWATRPYADYAVPDWLGPVVYQEAKSFVMRRSDEL